MKPILFNTEMVRAIMAGRKTVTRRVVKEPWYIEDEEVSRVTGLAMHRGTDSTHMMPYEGQPCWTGDILYVRETWCLNNFGYHYRANDNDQWINCDDVWRPSIHMPKEAARIFLRVTDVRVERLHEMGVEDVLKEGVAPTSRPGGCRCQRAFDGCMEEPCPNRTAYEIERHFDPFVQLWDSTIKPADRELYGWAANPWVWVIEFERMSREEATRETTDER